MTSLATDIRTLLSLRLASAPASEILAIASSLCANEAQMAPAAARATTPTGSRFNKLDDSRHATDHVAVFDSKTGLTWAAEPLQGGKDFTHAEALKACSELTLLGHNDWRAPTIEELLSIVDYTRCDPAVDTDYFKGPYGWTWSSTIAKAPAGYAWIVHLGGGGSTRGDQAYHGHARAVRAGQQLGLSV